MVSSTVIYIVIAAIVLFLIVLIAIVLLARRNKKKEVDESGSSSSSSSSWKKLRVNPSSSKVKKKGSTESPKTDSINDLSKDSDSDSSEWKFMSILLTPTSTTGASPSESKPPSPSSTVVPATANPAKKNKTIGIVSMNTELDNEFKDAFQTLIHQLEIETPDVTYLQSKGQSLDGLQTDLPLLVFGTNENQMTRASRTNSSMKGFFGIGHRKMLYTGMSIMETPTIDSLPPDTVYDIPPYSRDGDGNYRRLFLGLQKGESPSTSRIPLDWAPNNESFQNIVKWANAADDLTEISGAFLQEADDAEYKVRLANVVAKLRTNLATLESKKLKEFEYFDQCEIILRDLLTTDVSEREQMIPTDRASNEYLKSLLTTDEDMQALLKNMTDVRSGSLALIAKLRNSLDDVEREIGQGELNQSSKLEEIEKNLPVRVPMILDGIKDIVTTIGDSPQYKAAFPHTPPTLDQ